MIFCFLQKHESRNLSSLLSPITNSDPPQSSPTEATPSLPAQSVNAPVFVPKSSTPVLSAATPSVQSVGSPVSASNLTSPSRSNPHSGWSDSAGYDEDEDPFDPFSNYQYGNGYDNGVDNVTQRLQAVSFLSHRAPSHELLCFSPPWATNIDLTAIFQLDANVYDDPHTQHPFLPSDYPSPSVDYYQHASAFIRQPVRGPLHCDRRRPSLKNPLSVAKLPSVLKPDPRGLHQ